MCPAPEPLDALLSTASVMAAEIDFDWRRTDIVFSFFTPFVAAPHSFKARASGVLLVAGVGSYCAYRICTRFLGRRFVWMLLDSARCDQLARADLRLLHPSHLEPLDEERENEEDEEGDRHSESEWLSRVSGSRPASEMSVGRLQRVRRSIRARGLLGLHQSRTPRSGVLRREGGSVAGSSQKSAAPRDSSPSMASECSASLRIVWEGHQMWDDEFAPPAHVQPSAVTRVGPLALSSSSRNGTPSHILPAASMGDLCSVFDDILSVTTRDEQLDFQCEPGDDTFRGRDVEEEEKITESYTETNQESMLKKCMTDSKYMYQSVVLGSEFGGSNAGSVCSVRSAASNLHALKRRLNRTVQPNGLWDLTHEAPSTSGGLRARDPMTDSGLSSGIRSEEGRSAKRSLFDSALGADLFSSEDESAGGDRPNRPSVRLPSAVSELSERHSVAGISVTSLEWFDEGLRPASGTNLDSDVLEADLRVPINGLDLDWDLRDAEREGSRFGEFGSLQRAPVWSRRPSHTRDTMVFACENIQPHSPAFKTVQSLYSRGRLKRVGAAVSSGDDLLISFLSSLLYHDVPLPSALSPQQINAALSSAFERYNVLQRWEGEGTTKNRLEGRLNALSHLFQDPSADVCGAHANALRLFLFLRSIDIFERRMNGDSTFSWFEAENPVEAMHALRRKEVDQALLQLLCWSFSVRLEVVDCSTKTSQDTPHSFALGGGPHPPLHWLRANNNVFYPLFYVPDV